jgi:DNA invertase Pin-like site-specific DNA recombinase
MTEFIAYYRVSTDRQGASGLGLAAQRQAVARFIGASHLVAEYTKVESGKKHSNRPQLHAALADCRKRRAVLLIARLDRLARNVAFIANLMESGVDFVAVDMPQATRLTIHILAAVAEHERDMISKRTKAALAEAKRRGTKLGNPHIEEARALALAAHHARRPALEVLKLMTEWRQQGRGLRQIARDLNRLHIRRRLPVATLNCSMPPKPSALILIRLKRPLWHGSLCRRLCPTRIPAMFQPGPVGMAI